MEFQGLARQYSVRLPSNILSPEWAPRTVHPRTVPNRTEHLRAESPPCSKFSSASRTESGSQCSRSIMYGSNSTRAEPNRLLECSIRYGSARGCTVKSDRLNRAYQRLLKTGIESSTGVLAVQTGLPIPYILEPYRAFSSTSRTESGFQCSRSTMYGSNSIRAEPNRYIPLAK